MCSIFSGNSELKTVCINVDLGRLELSSEDIFQLSCMHVRMCMNQASGGTARCFSFHVLLHAGGVGRCSSWQQIECGPFCALVLKSAPQKRKEGGGKKKKNRGLMSDGCAVASFLSDSLWLVMSGRPRFHLPLMARAALADH